MTLCDDLEALAGSLDAIWAYATVKWLTLRVPGADSRLHRCPLDPRWLQAQRVTWEERAIPITRRRKRGGATTAQALGCLLSNLGSIGGLPFAAGAANDSPGRSCPSCGEEAPAQAVDCPECGFVLPAVVTWPRDPDVEEDPELAASSRERMTQAEASLWIRQELRAIVMAFASRAERDLCDGIDDLREVVASLMIRRRATVSRFSEFVGKHWEAG